MYRMRVIGLVNTQAQMIRQLSPVITFCSRMPHAAQLASILLFFVGSSTHSDASQLQFANHLIQINRDWWGKVHYITLTVTSCVLALLGSMWTALATIHIWAQETANRFQTSLMLLGCLKVFRKELLTRWQSLSSTLDSNAAIFAVLCCW